MSSDLRRPAIEAGRFSCHEPTADARTAARIREDFGCWLRRRLDLDETHLCDVVLAVNEALANACEFAYPGDRPGAVHLDAVHDPSCATLTVTVSDQGRWRDGDPLHSERSRGRGIPLMRSLADGVVIETSGLGTRVGLRFDSVRARRPMPAAAG